MTIHQTRVSGHIRQVPLGLSDFLELSLSYSLALFSLLFRPPLSILSVSLSVALSFLSHVLSFSLSLSLFLLPPSCSLALSPSLLLSLALSCSLTRSISLFRSLSLSIYVSICPFLPPSLPLSLSDSATTVLKFPPPSRFLWNFCPCNSASLYLGHWPTLHLSLC